MRVSVNRELCIGHGECAWIAPDVFGLSDDDGAVVLLRPHPSADLHEAVLDAQHSCPGGAIEVATGSTEE
ncbi:hypothetical protein GCM10009557_87340 [Virgisporangium ochraceum]|uniref:Ferredoxin n=1 Tax=Virgisporangium ochraceum TaxID=65505 RepID=A0A8J4A6N8_9ACTN|nr:hypothetical protein Voc01_087380 [Virgisporangium ochraceum]